MVYIHLFFKYIYWYWAPIFDYVRWQCQCHWRFQVCHGLRLAKKSTTLLCLRGFDFQGSCEAFNRSSHSYIFMTLLVISIFTSESPLPSPPLPWLLLLKRSSLEHVFSKGSFSVRYNLKLILIINTLAKKSNNSLGSGIYTGIFIMYLLCPSNKSRTTIILFYAMCLLYVLTAVTLVLDVAFLLITVSNNSIRKNTIFHRLCSRILGIYQFHFKLPKSPCYFDLRIPKPQQSLCVTSSPNVSWYA